MTALVQKWVTNPAGNNGAMVKLSNETSFTVFRTGSSEFWIPLQAPKLDVTFTAPMQ